MSASTVPAKTTSTSSNQANVASTLTAPTTSSTMTSATENVNKTSSTGTTDSSAPRSQFTGPTDNANAGPTTGGGKETSGTCYYWILVMDVLGNRKPFSHIMISSQLA